MKKRDDQRGGGTQGTDHDPSPPTPHPVAPEVAIELSSCLPDDAMPVFKHGIMDALSGAGFANGEVLMKCAGGRQRVGIWTTHLTPAGEQDRELGLPEINLLNAQERADPFGYAFRISAQLIERFGDDAWNKAPKRLNSESQAADPHGDVILRSFDIDFIAPNRVKTTIKATKLITDPAPDVELTLVRNDTLTVPVSTIVCHSDSSTSSDRSALLAFVIPLAIVFPIPLFQVVTSKDSKPGHEGGAGCAAAAMFPTQVLIPNTNFKLVFKYARVVVNEAGITAGGTMQKLGRDSAIAIEGPKDLNVIRGLPSVGARFALTTRELRPPLSITWSGAEFEHPHQFSTDATFLIGAQLHLQEERVVKVKVTDADNFKFETTHHLTIHIQPDER